MPDNNIKTKEEILKGLIISEEDTKAQLQELVGKTKELFRIEEKTKKVILSPNLTFNNEEKILLYLIGKYFSRELHLVNEDKFKLKEISDDLGVKSTTLSKPLGQACSNGLVLKEGEFYSIAHYRIKDIVDSIIQKDEPKNGKPKKRPARRPGKKGPRKMKKEQPDREKIMITANPKGIEDLAKDLGIEEERLHRLFEIDGQEIHMLETLKGTTESGTQFNTALVLLTVRFYYFRTQEMEPGNLYRILEDLDISAIGHLRENLTKDRRLLIPKKKNKRIETYRITKPAGIEEGLRLLKEYFFK